jgi:LysM repeat protein
MVLSLEGLKSKYASVIQEAQAQGVRITDIHEDNGKLVIKGTSPSVEATNNVWNEIKRVNPLMDDISASLLVVYLPSDSQSTQSDYNSSTQPQPLRAKPSEPDNSSSTTPSGSGGQTYTVKPGDSLTSISKQFYGNMKDYKRILEANRGKIGNKNLIHAGQELIIP